MARSSLFLQYSQRRYSHSTKGFFFIIPTTLALITSLLILFYIFTTSTFFTYQHIHVPHEDELYLNRTQVGSAVREVTQNGSLESPKDEHVDGGSGVQGLTPSQLGVGDQLGTNGNNPENNDVFHNQDIFLEDYKQMNRSLKIYVYPHRRDEPFANVLLPVNFEPGGNYASESYFKKVLMKSHYITKDPARADLFFLPFSIARLRHDPRIGVRGIQEFIRDYIFNISQRYPYWNRTGGADHFYVACHSIGRSAMEKADAVKWNAIQVVCSSSYFLPGYVSHKDASLPQIWPRRGILLILPHLKGKRISYSATSFSRGHFCIAVFIRLLKQKGLSIHRTKLAFFAGGMNSPVRERLLQVWGNDNEIFAHSGRLKTPYSYELLGSKFCLHVKGFEVNTARIGDALYYGCVPVIIANHYDLPFADILNWKSFSIVVATLDIPFLKKILKEVTQDEYLTLQGNLMKVRKHFQWHLPPLDHDAFYMVMYELWLRRSSIRLS